MSIQKYVVNDLSEYYQIISLIAHQNKIKIGCPLWFRGHAYASYDLLPSIMRKNDADDKVNNEKTYNTEKLREDYRLQNYKARVYHLTTNKPTSKLEWQALYQHNFGKTRLMDWSESARTALSFSLEAFLDPRELTDLDEKRKTITPTVWVLNPKKLNRKVFDYFGNASHIEKIEKALDSLGLSSESFGIKNELQKSEYYFNINKKCEDDIAIDGILNLGVIDEYRYGLSGDLGGMIKKYEFNPFFYLCLRYYVDALPFDVNDINDLLPPLAILHQYQGERIRAQRGAFTIFPNYNISSDIQEYKRIGYDCRTLENQSYIDDCLYQIRILNPNEVAKQLLLSGERRTELYPENEYFANNMEATKFFV